MLLEKNGANIFARIRAATNFKFVLKQNKTKQKTHRINEIQQLKAQ